MEPIPDLFKGKVVCKCCIQRNKLQSSQNMHLVIEEKTEKIEKIETLSGKKALIINKGAIAPF